MTRPHRNPRKRSGVILFVVVMVVALAALAAYTFVVAVQGDNKAAHLGADQLQVDHIACSGEAFVTAWLAQPRSERALLSEEIGQEVFTQTVTRPTLDTDPAVAGHFFIVQPITLSALSSLRAPNTIVATASRGNMSGGIDSLEGSPWRVGVVNESGKLHLATLLDWDEEWPGSARNALRQLPGMTMETADAILDWIDEDAQPREFGAEAETYQQRARPYAPANRVPDSLEELLLVRGVSRLSLFGEATADHDTNITNRLTADSSLSGGPNQSSGSRDNLRVSNSASSQNLAGGVVQPWSSFLTVHGAHRNETFLGQRRIHVNNKDLGELYGELQQRVPAAVANFIVLYRQFGPVKLDGDDDSRPAGDSDGVFESAESVDVDSDKAAQHKLKSIADLIDAMVRLPEAASDDDEDSSGGSAADDSDDRPRYVRSPITLESLSDPEFDTTLDMLTTRRSNRSIVGRLNLYDAPLPVIAGLPLLRPGQAEQIAAARDTADSMRARQGFGWLIDSGAFTLEAFRAIAPYLTLGGDVVSFQVIGSHADRSLFHRYAVTVDGTLDPIRRVAYRDLRRQGYPNMFDSLPRPNKIHGSGQVSSNSPGIPSSARHSSAFPSSAPR